MRACYYGNTNVVWVESSGCVLSVDLVGSKVSKTGHLSFGAIKSSAVLAASMMRKRLVDAVSKEDLARCEALILSC